MKIKDIRASVHRLPIYLPGFAEPTEHRHHVFCEVETDEGHVGHGMTARFLTRAVASALMHDILPAVRGMDPRNIEAVHDRVGRVVSERGQMNGVNLAAVSCLDIALWDVIGKPAGRTVAQLLGGHRDFATVYMTYGFGNYDRDQLAELALELIAGGYNRLKMLVGVPGLGWREDAARVRHVRSAIGEAVELALDADRLRRRAARCQVGGIRHPVPVRRPRGGRGDARRQNRGGQLDESFRKSAGLKVLGFGEIGFRNISNNVRPIVKPADLDGVKLRVPGSKTRILAFEMLGAAPINMNIGEVYLALQQGVVDGQENPLGNIRKWSWYEVQKYISISRHVYTPITFVMNLRRYDSLTDEQRAAVGRAARAAVLASRAYGTENDAKLLAEITELAKGKVAFNEIDVAAFQEAAKPIAVEIGKVAGEDFTASVMAAISQ